MDYNMLKCLFIVLLTGTSVMAQVGDYNKISTLNYYSDNTNHGSPVSCCCAIMQMQNWLKTGTDIQLSPQFMLVTADKKYDPSNQITVQHGISSPTLCMEISRTDGSCPLSMLKTPIIKWWPTSLTSAMKTEALKYRTGYNFFTLNDVPDYSTALVHLATNYGDAILLTTDGYQAYAIIGLDQQGRGIWLDFYKTSGKPKVSFLNDNDGTKLWNSMIMNKSFAPSNYMIGLTIR